MSDILYNLLTRPYPTARAKSRSARRKRLDDILILVNAVLMIGTLVLMFVEAL
jgi:hypothetical protein